jgi:hypothetical protein
MVLKTGWVKESEKRVVHDSMVGPMVEHMTS